MDVIQSSEIQTSYGVSPERLAMAEDARRVYLDAPADAGLPEVRSRNPR